MSVFKTHILVLGAGEKLVLLPIEQASDDELAFADALNRDLNEMISPGYQFIKRQRQKEAQRVLAAAESGKLPLAAIEKLMEDAEIEAEWSRLVGSLLTQVMELGQRYPGCTSPREAIERAYQDGTLGAA